MGKEKQENQCLFSSVESLLTLSKKSVLSSDVNNLPPCTESDGLFRYIQMCIMNVHNKPWWFVLTEKSFHTEVVRAGRSFSAT